MKWTVLWMITDIYCLVFTLRLTVILNKINFLIARLIAIKNFNRTAALHIIIIIFYIRWQHIKYIWLSGSVASIAACGLRGGEFDAALCSSCPIRSDGLNNYDRCHVAVLGKLFTHRGGAYANSAFHTSGIGKWGPASAGKAKLHSIHV